MHESALFGPRMCNIYFFAIALWAASALLPSFAHSQTAAPNLINAGYEYYPSTKLQDIESVDGSADSTPESEIKLDAFRIQGQLPLLVAPSTVILPQLEYTRINVSPRNVAADEVNTLNSEDYSLNALILRTLLIRGFNQRWSGVFGAGVGLASDFSGDLDLDDVVVTATAMALYTLRSGFSLGFGIGYDRRTGQLLPLPNISINWRPSDNWALRGFMPANFEVAYRAAERVSLVTWAALDGERYHLDEDKNEVENLDLAYSVVKLCPSVVVRLGESIHLRTSGCAIAGRRFELFVGDDSAVEGGLAATWMASVDLWLGPDPWKLSSQRQSPISNPKAAAAEDSE